MNFLCFDCMLLQVNYFASVCLVSVIVSIVTIYAGILAAGHGGHPGILLVVVHACCCLCRLLVASTCFGCLLFVMLALLKVLYTEWCCY